MKKLSIVGKDYHTEEHVVGYYNAGDRMMYWGKLGAFWGGLWGMLFGSAVLLGAGHWSAARRRTARHVDRRRTRRRRVVGGFSALGAALFSIGIPEDSVMQYEAKVKNGKLLLIVHGTPEEVRAGQGYPG